MQYTTADLPRFISDINSQTDEFKDKLVAIINSNSINLDAVVTLCETHADGHIPDEDIDLMLVQHAPSAPQQTDDVEMGHRHNGETSSNMADADESSPLLAHAQTQAQAQAQAQAQTHASTQVSTVAFLNGLLRCIIKANRHTGIQTTVKLGTGAAAWQIAEIVGKAAGLAGWPLYVAEGVAASLGVIAGMLGSQAALNKWAKGRTPAELLRVSLKVFIPVLVADMLWSPLTDLAEDAVGGLDNDAQKGAPRILLLFALYTSEAFVFSILQSVIDHTIHTKEWLTHLAGVPQDRFMPDKEFTTKVASAYVGFNAVPWLLTQLFKAAKLSGFEAEALAPLWAGLGTASIPGLLTKLDTDNNADAILELAKQLQTAQTTDEDTAAATTTQVARPGGEPSRISSFVDKCLNSAYSLWSWPLDHAHTALEAVLERVLPSNN